MTDLRSDRVRLIAATNAMLDAEDKSTEALAALLGLPVPAEWPPEHNGPETRGWVRKMMAAYPAETGWFSWYVVSPTDGLAGIAGYKGPPNDEGEVEIGYSVIPVLQRQGLGAGAIRLLCTHAFAHPSVTAVTAETLPTLIPSQRVLEKTGFRRVSEYQDPEAGTIWRYRLDR